MARLLLSALRAGDIDRQLRVTVPCCRHRSSAANAGSVMLRADGGGGLTQTCLYALKRLIVLTAITVSRFSLKLRLNGLQPGNGKTDHQLRTV